ncbi:enoyl-CoA hydratase [Aureimonas frigidaquae]|uniref:Enoyl-CoA hydratase/isomerase n=1 Tax=Aureimonas frigidaquae TaxID=424757 RepID=A0A0P0Z374_9HYPH|nr:enoyl-CoA hydratase [Aureimonas frigidaquae]BAT28541.1 enoyl-CoA hydratase/isomerase [Aureimonas frigidaquae]
MSAPSVIVGRSGPVTEIRFDNPAAHNALTTDMWHEMRRACEAVAQDASTRVVVFRGTGGKAFVSGTDISGFSAFQSGADGVAYEAMIDACMEAVDRVPQTTIAVVEGWAVGGGLNIACACDFRIATTSARFGSPIGRTLGNCLSAATIARVGAAVGLSVARRMVLLGEIIEAEELAASGFLLRAVEPDALAQTLDAVAGRAAENAPLTSRAFKETARRITQGNLPDTSDLIERVYGSADFKRGVATFLGKTRTLPDWTGD